MKKSIIFMLFMFLNSFLYAKKVFQLYDTVEKKVLKTMTFKQFQAIVKTSESYLEIERIEKNKNVEIISKKKFLLISDMEEEISFHIKWIKKENVKIIIVKDLYISGKLNFKKEPGISKTREVYRDISEVGFPVTTLLLTLATIILVAL